MCKVTTITSCGVSESGFRCGFRDKRYRKWSVPVTLQDKLRRNVVYRVNLISSFPARDGRLLVRSCENHQGHQAFSERSNLRAAGETRAPKTNKQTKTININYTTLKVFLTFSTNVLVCESSFPACRFLSVTFPIRRWKLFSTDSLK